MNIEGDNETSFILVKNLESQYQTNQINLIYHYIRSRVEKNKLIIE